MSETQVTTEAQVEITDDLDAFSTDFFGEKPVDSEPAKADEANEDSEDDEAPVTEAQTDDTDPNEDAEAEFKEAPPKKKTVQDRIDEVVKQREDQKRDFEAKLAALEARIAEKTVEKPVPETSEPQPDDTLENGEPKYTLGEFDPAYIRDLTRFTLNAERTQANIKAEEQRVQREQQEATQQLTSSWNEKVTVAKEQYPDLVEKGEALLNGFKDLNEGYANYLSTVLMSMDHGPDVLYYLSNNPEEAKSIVNSGAQRATLALGRIEAKFVEAAATKTLAKPKVSKAPPPPTATARGTGGGQVSVAPDTDDLKAFEREFFAKK